MAQFNRVFRLTLGVQGKKGRVIEADGRAEGLRVEFAIERDLTQETNKSNVRISNLAPQTAKELEADDVIALLEAGYAEDIGLRRIFVGAVTAATTTWEDAGTVTSLELSDGQIPLRDTVLALSYAPGVLGRKIFDDIAGQMGLSSYIAPDAVFASYPNGYSYIGKASPCLDKICRAAGLVWSIQNNILTVILAGGSTGIRALVFSADSGLIGSPERIVKGVRRPDKEAQKKRKVKKDKTEKRAGWKITALLAPTVNPGDLVRIESPTVTGWFRVESLRHTGDSRGQEWYSELELIEIKRE
jgi:hypothetical protein